MGEKVIPSSSSSPKELICDALKWMRNKHWWFCIPYKSLKDTGLQEQLLLCCSLKQHYIQQFATIEVVQRVVVKNTGFDTIVPRF